MHCGVLNQCNRVDDALWCIKPTYLKMPGANVFEFGVLPFYLHLFLLKLEHEGPFQ